MQTLVELLLELKNIASEPDSPSKLARINAMFSDPRAPAELQVGRHFVARLLVPSVDTYLASLDPAQRRTAVTTAQLVFPRTSAARVLRRVVKDPDPRVRSAARKAVVTLGLRDVAPPDIRYKVNSDSPIGGFNPTGWAFGMFPNDTSAQRKPKKASRKKALDQYKLPNLADRDAVAAFAGVDAAGLTALMRPGTGQGSGYVEFEIPKAKGGTRRIAAPRTPLRKIQRKILDEILAKLPVHDACHGFVPGRSTVTNAKPHEGAAIVVKLDLKDFFPTVHYRRVKGLFAHIGYNEEVAGALAGLTTYRPKIGELVVWPGLLPQGAPTSPAIANLTCRRLDQRLARLAAKYAAVYTRYADDLTFSFAVVPDVRIGRFLWWVDAICQQEGFTERDDKRRILRAKHQQRVTGLVVNERVNVPRADRRKFRAILHNCAKHGVASQAQGNPDFAAYLAGYAAYVHMVDPDLGKHYIAEVARLLGEAPNA
ncbi:MAG TPA: reverse transcriptase domain-containing protein [Kofleriaceae bacterium]|nr:reverse transcriptase domain-containing protein [Kofleriaceae bacterium]